MAYENEAFVKLKDAIEAPAGFHYMPNGKLMSDADHIAMYGYIEKTINSVIVDTADLSFGGETRVVTVQCEEGGVFSLEIYDDSNNYYNFTTKVFSSTKPSWEKIESKGTNTFSIKFPVTAGSVRKYTIDVRAEIGGNIKTKHNNLQEARFVDNTIDYNNSSGSDSDVLRKILYQDAAKRFNLSCIAPSKYATSASTVNGATSTQRLIIDGDATTSNLVQAGDKITITDEVATGIHMLVTEINPDRDNVNEMSLSVADTITDGVTVTFTPPFNGMNPHSSDSDTGRFTVVTSTGKNFKSGFTVEIRAGLGRVLTALRTPTTNDLCTFVNRTIGSAALPIQGENTSSSTVFHRFPVDNIAGLSEGMTLDPARSGGGANTTTPASISQYLTTKTSTEPFKTKYHTGIREITLDDVFVPGVEATAEATTIDRNGVITAQTGNIVFDTQQADALKGDSEVRIFAHGAQQIKNMTGMTVTLSDVVVTPRQVSVTTSGSVSNSTTVPLTDLDSVAGLTGVQSVRGVNINPAAANPTVTSKSAHDGAGNMILSGAQTLESGQTLFLDGASQTILITGTIEVQNMALAETDIFFDVERFLRAT